MSIKLSNAILSLILLSSFFAIGLPTDDIHYLALALSSMLLMFGLIQKNSLYLSIFVLFLFGLNGMLNFDKGINFSAIFQFFVSITLGACIFGYLTKRYTFLNDKSTIGIIIFILLFLMLLEIIGFTTPIVNSYRINFLGVTPDIIANDHARDIRMNGFSVRPTLFMKEASYAYCFLFFMTSVYLVLNKKLIVLISMFLLSAFLFVIYRSPSVFLAISFYTFVFLLDYSEYLRNFTRRTKLIFAALVFALIVVSFLFVQDHLLGRISAVDFSDRSALNSVTIRLVAPIYFVFDTYRNYPMFGIGISNLDFAYEKFGIIGNNGFANLICFFGFFGIFFLGVIYVLWGKAKSMSKKELVCGFGFLFVILNQLGGTTTFLVWFYFFVFLGVLHSSKNSQRCI